MMSGPFVTMAPINAQKIAVRERFGDHPSSLDPMRSKTSRAASAMISV
jgi:hypothetical protein